MDTKELMDCKISDTLGLIAKHSLNATPDAIMDMAVTMFKSDRYKKL